jgi:hypothetical protein
MSHLEPRRFEIEQFFAEELNGIEAVELEKHIESCQVCNSYLQTLRREKNEFLADHPFSSLCKTKERSIEVPWYVVLYQTLTKPSLVPLYGMMLLLAVIIPIVSLYNSNRITDTVRFKGRSQLSFVCLRDGSTFQGNSEDLFRAGDQIQIRYNSEKEQFVALLSIDSRGTVSFYHPDQRTGFCSVKSGIGSDLTFPGSIILDNSPGGELVIALFSPQPMRIDLVKQWVSGLNNGKDDFAGFEHVLEKNKITPECSILTILLKKG